MTTLRIGNLTAGNSEIIFSDLLREGFSEKELDKVREALWTAISLSTAGLTRFTDVDVEVKVFGENEEVEEELRLGPPSDHASRFCQSLISGSIKLDPRTVKGAVTKSKGGYRTQLSKAPGFFDKILGLLTDFNADEEEAEEPPLVCEVLSDEETMRFLENAAGCGAVGRRSRK